MAGVPVLAASATDLLLHLCVHMSVKHRFEDSGLRSSVDVAEVCRRRRDAIRWDEFAGRARIWGVGAAVRVSLELAADCTDLAVPEGVLAALEADPPDEDTMNWARHKLIHGASAALHSEVVQLEARPGLGAKLAALRAALFPSRAGMAEMYRVPAASWRIFVYYPVRLWDVWVRHHSAVWQIVRRDKAFTTDARREARLRQYLGWR